MSIDTNKIFVITISGEHLCFSFICLFVKLGSIHREKSWHGQTTIIYECFILYYFTNFKQILSRIWGVLILFLGGTLGVLGVFFIAKAFILTILNSLVLFATFFIIFSFP